MKMISTMNQGYQDQPTTTSRHYRTSLHWLWLKILVTSNCNLQHEYNWSELTFTLTVQVLAGQESKSSTSKNIQKVISPRTELSR